MTGRFQGDVPFLVAVLTFESMAALRAAFESDAGRACADDRRLLAPADDDSTMLIFDDEEIAGDGLAGSATFDPR